MVCETTRHKQSSSGSRAQDKGHGLQRKVGNRLRQRMHDTTDLEISYPSFFPSRFKSEQPSAKNRTIFPPIGWIFGMRRTSHF